MAKEDFCFTYYDGDAARDKAHMTRLERGAYDDIISAQRKRGHLSIEDIKKVLGRDFEACWSSLEWVLEKDDEGKYYIEWVDKSIAKMRAASRRQKEKAAKRWSNRSNAEVMPRHTNSTNSVMPFLENGNGNENGEGNGNEEKGGVGENGFQAIGIVHVMAKQFADANPGYPWDNETDYANIREIGDRIARWKKLPPGGCAVLESCQPIQQAWGELIPFIRGHPLFGGWALKQINKNFSMIIQSFTNGKDRKPGTKPVPAIVGKGGFGQL